MAACVYNAAAQQKTTGFGCVGLLVGLSGVDTRIELTV